MLVQRGETLEKSIFLIILHSALHALLYSCSHTRASKEGGKKWQPFTKWNRLGHSSVIKATDTSAEGNAAFKHKDAESPSPKPAGFDWCRVYCSHGKSKSLNHKSPEKTSWEGHSNQHDWSGQENRRTELDMVSHPLTSARPSNPNPDFLNQYHLKKSSTKVGVTLWSQDFQWK